MSVEMKFMGRTARLKINEDILSELKINSIVKKVQNYWNKWIHVW
jgi:hypothetical protein